MEHKLIQGGEQFLPFARSRIKALRATGLQHASQQFEVDGISVKARIAGEHDYIRIQGGGGNVLSGVILDGNITNATGGAKKYLSFFRPTQQAWTAVMKQKPVGAGPTVFSTSEKLAVNISGEIVAMGSGNSQNTHVFGSMYSGKMAPVVQFLAGCGILTATQPDGLVISYAFHHTKTHGITVAADGKPWLIEISESRGVLAMPLPKSSDGTILKNASLSAISKITSVIGFIPSGGTFPKDAALAAAITDGTVLQLISAASLTALFAKFPLDSRIGWSFNDSGSEAHNVVFFTDGTYRGFPGYKAAHYKFNIEIGATVEVHTPGNPLATATASLVLVEEKYRLGTALINVSAPVASGGLLTVIPLPNQGGGGLIDEYPAKWPVFACHINGTLEVIYAESRLIPWTGGGFSGQLSQLNTMTSPRFSAITTQISSSSSTSSVIGSNQNSYPVTKRLSNEVSEALTQYTLVLPNGTRSGYVMVKRRGVRQTGTYNSIIIEYGSAGTAIGLPDVSFPATLDPWVTIRTDYGPIANIVLPDGTVIQNSGEDWVRTTTESGRITLGGGSSEPGTSVEVRAPDLVPEDIMGWTTNASYFVRYSSLGGAAPNAVYSRGSEWPGRNMTAPNRAQQTLHTGIFFANDPTILADLGQYSFVGYV